VDNTWAEEMKKPTARDFASQAAPDPSCVGASHAPASGTEPVNQDVGEIYRVASIMTAVKSVDCDTARDALVRNAFKMIAQLTVQKIDPLKPLHYGNKAPQGIVVVTGESGAGKTHAIKKAIAQNPIFTQSNTLTIDCPISSTSKGLGLSLLHALDYPAKDHMADNRVWSVLKEQLRKHKISFVWIDEIQHIFHMPSKKTVSKTSDALKTLTIDNDWPTSVIASGLPSIKSLWAGDNQLKRRKKVVSIPLINVIAEADQLLEMLLAYSAAASLAIELIPPHLDRDSPAYNAAKENFKNKVIYPVIVLSDYALGSSLDFMCEAIRCAVSENASILSLSHFEMALRLKDDVLDEDNLFAFDNWQQILV
jgi:hypothetical protein